MYFDLALNLSLLIALSSLSGFISQRLVDGKVKVALLQGALFGLASVLAMFRPAVIEPGVIFDGRSVMISVCALFFGPWAAAVSGIIAVLGRVWIGGPGIWMGLMVIATSLSVGLWFRRQYRVAEKTPTAKQLYWMGVAVHLAFIAAIFGLPEKLAMHTLQNVAVPVIVLYPLATILAGKIIGDRKQLNRSLAQLQRANELKSITLRSIGDGIIAGDLDGRVTEMNPVAERLSGWSSHDAIGKPLTDVLRITPALAIQTAVEGVGSGIPNEAEIISRTGAKFSISGSIDPLKDEQGRVLGVVLTLRDRTDEIKAQAAVRVSESRYRSVVESSPDIIVRCDKDHRIVFANPSAERILGWKVDVDHPRSIRELNTPIEECQQWEAACKQVLATGKFHEFEVTHQGQDGEIILSARLIPEPQQSDTLLAIMQDVTERRRSESKMHLLTSALNAAANAIVVTDKTGRIEWINPAFSRFTGYSSDEAMGVNPGEILRSGKHPVGFYENMWATIGAGKVWSGEMINRRKDGTIYTEDMMITPIVDPLGRVTHYVAVKQDITQRKSLEAQVRHSQKMDAIGQLAGGVAHDFNNILASVLLNVGLLQMEEGMDHSKKQRLSELEKEIMKGASLARQLLSFSRKQAMEVVPLDLHGTIAALLRMLRRLVGEQVKIELKADDNLPRIQADLGMIEQVVVNLVVNARDAMPKGGTVAIHVEAIDITPDHVAATAEARLGRFVRLSVIDAGHGMDEEILQKIFEPFFTTKAVGKGTGLGLATVHGIVKQHGGWIEVESVVGSGSRFDVFIESSDAVEVPATPAAQLQRVGGGETILLAEDEQSLRVVISATLRRYGYRVIAAKTGHEALALWNENPSSIQLLITDMIMPEKMNGLDLAGKLRESRPDLKVIICTGYGADLLPTHLPPRTLLLKKPFQPSTLMTLLQQVFETNDGGNGA